MTIRQYIPARLKRMVRIATYWIIDKYYEMTGTRPPMTPPAMSALLVGSGDFKAIGKSLRSHLIEYCNMKPNSQVLEIGCGYGRVAIALSEFLNGEGSYDGVDVVKDATDWCTYEISKKYSNFRFHHADVSNPYAHKEVGQSAVEYRFPFSEGQFDVVFLTSVFSHMRPPEIEAYLKEIGRVLKVGGKCLATFYLLNDFSLKMISSRKSSQNFAYKFDGFLSTHSTTPEQTIAVYENQVREFHISAGLHIHEPVHYGSWSGRSSSKGYQDTMVSERR